LREKSGIRAVYQTRHGRWSVSVSKKYYGTYETIEEARVVAESIYAARSKQKSAAA
jgi:hypothetical protein